MNEMPVRLQRGKSPAATSVLIGDLRLVFSYETCVAFYHPETGWVASENIWSNTTGRHIHDETPVAAADRKPYQEFLRLLDAVSADHFGVKP